MTIINIKEVKTRLRNEYKNKRQRMPSEQKEKSDIRIANRLFSLAAYKKANTVFTYVSKDIEVDTINIINQCLNDKKRVAVPRCVPNTRNMDFYYITSLSHLEHGSFGVLEPNIEKCKKAKDFSNSICIVPGLCFDTSGYRLGYGKGYYDRFLSEFKQPTIGICYQNCIINNLPHGYFDKPVNILLTEQIESYISAV